MVETVAYINQTYPKSLVYNQATCKRDLGLIIDGIIIDVMNGLTANFNQYKQVKKILQSQTVD